MTEVSVPELVRRIETIERRVTVHEERFVLAAVYTRDMNEIRNDVTEIKDSQRWAVRLIAGQTVVLVVSLLMYLLTNVVGG